jgi:hypothetical protein
MWDSARALRAKADQAKRHAEDQRREAHEQRARAHEQRDAEARAVAAAQRAMALEAALLSCERCNATWRREAIRDATRRHPCCLLCGGPLAPVP